MRVVVLGVSGLLGRTISEHLLGLGHTVVGVSRSGTAGIGMTTEGSLIRADLTTATDEALDALLDGAGAVVYCLGADDRTALPAPVAQTLERVLVTTTVRCARAARRQRVPHMVVLGSYFTTFDRLHPEWALRRRHPYIQARADQATRATEAAPGAVSVLEIPYVFGAVPGVEPSLKKVFFDRLRRGPLGASFSGGTAAVTNGDVAQAATAIITGTAASGVYPLAVDNITYRQLTGTVLAELGRRVPVVTMPAPVLTAGVVATALTYRLRHRGMALNPRYVARDILDRRLYLDPVSLGAPLGLVARSVEPAIRETVRAAYPRQG
jgi:dihydroflavonol-4-reductase